MNQASERRAGFDRIWAPMIGFGIVLGFGVQPALPYISPFIALFFSGCAGALYYLTYQAVVGDAPFGHLRLYGSVLLIAGLAISLIVGVLQFTSTMKELAGPCERMRLQLLKQPNSVAADSYSALHCPIFLPRYRWPWE